MIELAIFIRLMRFVRFASAALSTVRAVPRTVGALVVLLTAHAHKRHVTRP